jgi:hypothetical protein
MAYRSSLSLELAGNDFAVGTFGPNSAFSSPTSIISAVLASTAAISSSNPGGGMPSATMFASGSVTGSGSARATTGVAGSAGSSPGPKRTPARIRGHESVRIACKIAKEVRPCDGKPPSRPQQRLWHVRFRPRHPSNRSRRPAPCYPRCDCHRTYSGKGDSILVSLSRRADSSWSST